jgi:hypothetical protein
MTSKKKEAYTVEQTYQDMMAGINIGIKDLTESLNNDINILGKNEMERALKAIINYPDSVNVYNHREERFIKNLVALHGLHLQAEIQSLAELQQEQDGHNYEQEQGEENV